MLTPLDIEKKEFKRRLGNYDRDDVEEFMGLILNDYEKMYRENIASKDRIDTLTDAVNHYKAQETTMQNAILAAQKAADELVKNSKEKAELIIREANNKAKDIQKEAKEKIASLENEYNNLYAEIQNYKIRVSAVINAQLEALKDLKYKPDRLSENKKDEYIDNTYKPDTKDNSQIESEENLEDIEE